LFDFKEMGWKETTLMVIHLLERNKSNRGRPCKATNREYLEEIFYVLKSGVQWNLLRAPLNWSTYYKKFRKWSQLGVFEISFGIIQKILKRSQYLTASDYRNLFIDSSMIQNSKGTDCKGRNHYDRFRFGTKVTVVVNKKGIPLGLKFSGSNVNDTQLVEPLISNLAIKIVGSRLIADKGYVSQPLKTRLQQQGIELIYPMRRNQRAVNTPQEIALLKERTIIENLFSWQQPNRHLKIRKDALINSYSSFYYLGLMEIINKKIDF
jgi:transposase